MHSHNECTETFTEARGSCWCLLLAFCQFALFYFFHQQLWSCLCDVLNCPADNYLESISCLTWLGVCHIRSVPQPYKGKLVESPVPLVCHLYCPSLPPVQYLILGITIYKHPQRQRYSRLLKSLVVTHSIQQEANVSHLMYCTWQGNTNPWQSKGEHSRWSWP